MKKLLLTSLTLLCAGVLMAQSQDAKPKHKMTAEQKEVMKEMLAKYDTNKDGKLDKQERAAMSQADKDKMKEAGLDKPKKNHDSTTSTNAPTATTVK